MTGYSSLTIDEVSAAALREEAAVVEEVLAYLAPLRPLRHEISVRAERLIAHAREHAVSGVEALLQAYPLSTSEGAALMALTEALPRIPDDATADRLIRDQLNSARWQKHGQAPLHVRASNFGLAVSGLLARLNDVPPDSWLHGLARTVGRIGEPLNRRALSFGMRHLSRQFVLAETIAQALKRAVPLQENGWKLSFDMLGEGARSFAQAEAYVAAYRHAIATIAATKREECPALSIKLSGLHPCYRLNQTQRVMDELLPVLVSLCIDAREAGIAVTIDAEEQARLDLSLFVYDVLLSHPGLKGWDGLGMAVQAYGTRALPVISWLARRAEAHGARLPVRLVKGAYWDSEIKAAQTSGLAHYPVFTRKAHTDLSYLACADRLLQESAALFAQFATHNAHTLCSVLACADIHGIERADFEIQRLFGMGEAVHAPLLGEVNSRIYAPVGKVEVLLPYLIRRLLENGANMSFVHRLNDPNAKVHELVADPFDAVDAQHASILPLPVDIYGAHRKNSEGVDFGNAHALHMLVEQAQRAASLSHPVCLPFCTLKEADVAMEQAASACGHWQATLPEERAAILLRAAEMLEEKRETLIALMANECGKTLADGVAEVREAADFCRYYAAEAVRLLHQPHSLCGPTGETNTLRLLPRGVFVCISPWNFPLAIFCGQITAALAAGNTVVAKPAEESPNVARQAVEILHAAGIPRDVLQLLPGEADIGARLVEHAACAGVAFTGSTQAAKSIARALAAKDGPIVPLIAETGGQNAMIVDSSALIEAAVDDIVLSAFGSAGQRCSALRVLYVQEEIADALLDTLQGAMETLTLGDPLDPATDIGPVISRAAQDSLTAHIARMEKEGRLVGKTPLREGLSGHFVAPHAFEIAHISQIGGEVFGPVLHVIRFAAGTLENVVQEIHSTGYGLTFGVHSRVPSTIDFLTSHVRAGNIYVNRGMTGAVVGAQPFGGEGLSGTGPKAGGPHYLPRFMTERTVTVNTAAIGGNLGLITQAE